MDVTSDTFREAWSHFATGVTVVTTLESDADEAGDSGSGVTVHGMTANGVASVSLEPPLALVVIAHERNTHPLVTRNRRFGISVLSARQEAVARHYTLAWEERRHLEPPAMERLGSSMVVDGALSAMDCRLQESYAAGDHTIFVGRVEAVKVGSGEPLVYHRRTFATLRPFGDARSDGSHSD